jgi:hypothetical protein
MKNLPVPEGMNATETRAVSQVMLVAAKIIAVVTKHCDSSDALAITALRVSLFMCEELAKQTGNLTESQLLAAGRLALDEYRQHLTHD